MQCDLFECTEGKPEGWSEEKSNWCCTEKGLGCEASTAVVDFDCQAGLDRWQTGWNKAKKQYCCDLGVVKCDAFDCDQGFANWEKAWSSDKKAWCCKKERRGCE